MGTCKTACVALFFALCAATASASAVGFQIIQHDPAQDQVRASSYVIENSLFDFFFDRGWVATNSPIAISDGEGSDRPIWSRALVEARMGRCDYFVTVTLDYNVENSVNPEAVILSNIRALSWSAYDLQTGRVLAGGTRETGQVPAARNNARGISRFAEEAARDIYEGLRRLK